MSEAIITALITGGLTLIGVLVSNSKAQAVNSTKIDELTREVREHNNFAKRMPAVEEQIKGIKDKKEIGQSGMVGFDAVFGNAEVAGLEGYVVEVEGCRNEAALDGIRVSADYLRKAPFVKASYGK